MRDSISLNRAVRNHLPLISSGSNMVSVPVSAILSMGQSRWRIQQKRPADLSLKSPLRL